MDRQQPIISNITDIVLRENAIEDAPYRLFDGLVLTGDPTALGGSLFRVTGLLPEDALRITEGNGVTVNGANVMLGARTVAIVSSAIGATGIGEPFELQFLDSGAGEDSVETVATVLGQISFTTLTDTPTLKRLLRYTLTDQNGAVSGPDPKEAPTFVAQSIVPLAGLGIGNMGPSGFDPNESNPIEQSRPALYDIDADGDLDAVVGSRNGTLAFFENDGGRFAPRTGDSNPFDGLDFGNHSAPTFVDFDQDGQDELFVADRSRIKYFEFVDGNWVEDSANNPFGTQRFSSFPVLSFGDVDGDGDDDAVMGFTGSPILAYFERIGDTLYRRMGDSNPFTDNSLGSQSAPALGDVDGDGDIDLVLGAANGDGYVFFNEDNSGLFTRADAREFKVSAHAAPTLGDLDGNGTLDLVIGSSDGTFLYRENAGSGEFTGVPLFGDPFASIDVGNRSAPVWIDGDNDGDLDVLVGSSADRWDYYRNDFGVFTAAPDESPVVVSSLGGERVPVLGDIDGDGDVDLVVGRAGRIFLYRNTPDDTGNPVFVRVNAAEDPFAGDPARDVPAVNVGNESQPALYDLDADGTLELFVGDNTGRVLMFARTDGLYVRDDLRNPFSGMDFGEFAAPHFVDLDGDGDTDLLLGARDGSVPDGVSGAGIIRYFENDGGIFVERTDDSPLIGIDAGLRAFPTAADYDNDGDIDLLTGRSDGRLVLYRNIQIDQEEIVVTVLPDNDAPRFDAPTSTEAVLEEGETEIVGVTVSDPERDAFTVRLQSRSLITLAGNSGVTFLEGDGIDDKRIHLSGTEQQINAALATLFVKLDRDEDTDGAIRLTSDDGADSREVVIDVPIAAVNDTPGDFAGALILSDLAVPRAASIAPFLQLNATGTGDTNGDGLQDLLIGSASTGPLPSSDNISFSEGRGFAVYGRADGFDGQVNLSDLTGYDGFALIEDPVNANARLGQLTTNIGDVNGDGIADLFLNGSVVFGRAGKVEGTVAVSSAETVDPFDDDLNGENGFVIAPVVQGLSWFSSASGGDFNGDGFADVFGGVTDRFAEGRSGDTPYLSDGRIWGVLGGDAPFDRRVDVGWVEDNNGSLIPQGQDITIFSSDDTWNIGSAIEVLPDINGDGRADLAIFAERRTGFGDVRNGDSRVYILFGQDVTEPLEIDLATLANHEGIVIDGLGEAVGYLDFLGSPDADGVPSLAIGAADSLGNFGAVRIRITPDLVGSGYIDVSAETLQPPLVMVGDVTGDGIDDWVETQFSSSALNIVQSRLDGEALDEIPLGFVIRPGREPGGILDQQEPKDLRDGFFVVTGSDGDGVPLSADLPAFAGPIDLNADGVNDVLFSAGSTFGVLFGGLGQLITLDAATAMGGEGQPDRVIDLRLGVDRDGDGMNDPSPLSTVAAANINTFLTVQERSINVLSSTHLSTTDPDHDADELTYVLRTPISQLTSDGSIGAPVPGVDIRVLGQPEPGTDEPVTFTQADLDAGRVRIDVFLEALLSDAASAYDFNLATPTRDALLYFGFDIVDAAGAVVEDQFFPIVMTNTPFAPFALSPRDPVDEGRTSLLSIEIFDADGPFAPDGPTVTFVAESSLPLHGTLRVGGPRGEVVKPGTVLTAHQTANELYYQHDGSETTNDRLIPFVLGPDGLSTQNNQVSIDINPINDAPGLSVVNAFRGSSDADRVGLEVDGGADFNGDGYLDFITRTRYILNDGPGEITVVYGTDTGFSGTNSLDDLGADGQVFLQRDYRADAVRPPSTFLSPDVNGDGYAELIVNEADQSVIIFGGPFSSGVPIAIADVVGHRALVFDAVTSLTPLGDIDGDGLGDLLVTRDDLVSSAASSATIIYGDTTITASTDPDLLIGPLDETGWIVPAGSRFSDTGRSEAVIGDLNNDGTPDIGAIVDGEPYIILSTESRVDLRDQGLAGDTAFRVAFQDAVSIAGIGDWNDDGFDDVAIGSDDKTIIVFGRAESFGEGAGSGSPAWLEDPDVVLDIPGLDLAGVGDVDQDGINDLLVGAGGASYLIPGRRGVTQTDITMQEAASSGYTFVQQRPSDRASVSALGDVNGDRVPDFAIGAPDNDVDGILRAGEVVVVLGGAAQLSQLKASGNGVIPISEDITAESARVPNVNRPLNLSGQDTVTLNAGVLRVDDPESDSDEILYTLTSVSSSGFAMGVTGTPLQLGQSFTQQDINLGNVSVTRIDDAMPNATFNLSVQDADSSGFSFALKVVDEPFKGSPFDDQITGTSADDLMFGGNGADTMQGLSGDDDLFGEGGDDQLFGGEGSDFLSGGGGNDLLNGDGLVG